MDSLSSICHGSYSTLFLSNFMCGKAQRKPNPILFNCKAQREHCISCLVKGTFVFIHVSIPIGKIPHSFNTFNISTFYLHYVNTTTRDKNKEIYFTIKTHCVLRKIERMKQYPI